MKLRCFLIGLLVAVVWLGAQAEEAEGEKALKQKLNDALKTANPQYSGKGVFRFRNGKLFMINLYRCENVNDLSPLKAFDLSTVVNLSLYRTGAIKDLSPIAGCNLKQINTENCKFITDLTPLKHMPIRHFRMCAQGVSDISALKDMPLVHLDLGNVDCKVSDLSPIQGKAITDLRIDKCPNITDISVIEGMPIKLLSIHDSFAIKDYTPITKLNKLESLYCSAEVLPKDVIEALRKMKHLKFIGDGWKHWKNKQTAEAFFKRYDAGDYKAAAQK